MIGAISLTKLGTISSNERNIWWRCFTVLLPKAFYKAVPLLGIVNKLILRLRKMQFPVEFHDGR